MKKVSMNNIFQMIVAADTSVPLCLEDEKGKQYTLFVTQRNFNKATKDIKFATELLNKHKAAIEKQRENATSTSKATTDKSDLVVLNSYDEQFHTSYELHVSQSDYDHACNDTVFATELLNKHKAAIEKQSENAISTAATADRSDLVSLNLYDEQFNTLYTLHVSQNDYDHACNDTVFASELLNKHKAAIEKQSENAISTEATTDRSELVELHLYNEQLHTPYTLLVSQNDYAHAINDITYATELLLKHKSRKLPEQSRQKVQPQASVSSCLPKRKLCESYEAENILQDSEDENSSEIATKGDKCTWSGNQTLLLLNLYKENEKKLSNGVITHRKFWKIISDGMALKGHNFTANQCSNKMDNLKRKYKIIIDHNAQSGNDRKTCDNFDLLDELFGKKPWANPLSTAGSNIPMNNKSPNNNLSCKRQKVAVEESKINFMQQCLEEKRLRREAAAEYREQKLKAFEKMLNLMQSSKQ